MDMILRFAIFFAGACLLAAAGYTYSQRRVSQMVGFSGFCFSASMYAIGYAFEISSTSVGQIRYALSIEYVGVATIPIFMLMMVFELVDRRDLITKRIFVPMTVISVITYALVATSAYHTLYYTGVDFRIISGITVATLGRSLLYYAYEYYVIAILLGTLIAIGRLWMKATDDLRVEYGLIFMAVLMPGIGSILYYLRLTPYGMDPSPAMLVVTAILFVYAINSNMLITMTSRVREILFYNMSLTVIVLNRHDRIIDYNDGVRNLVDIEGKTIIGRKVGDVFGQYDEFMELVNDDTREDCKDAYCILEGEHGHISATDLGRKRRHLKTIRNRKIHFAGKGDNVYMASKCLIMSEGGHIVGKYVVISDITSEENMIKMLNHLASHDGLTKVMNRLSFFTSCRELFGFLENGSDVAVLMIDIDFFKRVNDTYGHMGGDEVLKSLAAVFQSSIRSRDILARYGGEEFVVLLNEMSLESAKALAERLRLSVEALEVHHLDDTIRVTTSIGVCYARYNGQTIDDFIESADKALYMAKNNGRNRVEVISI